MSVTIKIDGLTHLLAAERTIGAKTEGILTTHLKTAGDAIARDVQTRYQPYSVRGGLGVQAKVFTSGLWVVQTIRRSRNPLRERPNFGGLMMLRSFLPAARDNEGRILLAAELSVQEVERTYWNTIGA